MYSHDVRTVVKNLYSHMKSLRKVAFFINISRSTVHRWISYESNERKLRVSMIKPIVLQSIEAYVKTHPFATILETRKVVSEEFKINPSKELVRLAVKKCGFTRKRARQFSQPNNLEEKINSFIQAIFHITRKNGLNSL